MQDDETKEETQMVALRTWDAPSRTAVVGGRTRATDMVEYLWRSITADGLTVTTPVMGQPDGEEDSSRKETRDA